MNCSRLFPNTTSLRVHAIVPTQAGLRRTTSSRTWSLPWCCCRRLVRILAKWPRHARPGVETKVKYFHGLASLRIMVSHSCIWLCAARWYWCFTHSNEKNSATDRLKVQGKRRAQMVKMFRRARWSEPSSPVFRNTRTRPEGSSPFLSARTVEPWCWHRMLQRSRLVVVVKLK